MPVRENPLIEKVESLQNLLLSFSTGGGGENSEYQQLRTELMSNPLTKEGIPKCVVKARDLGQFWQFIKYKFATYQERRTYLWDEFRPLLEALESLPGTPFELTDRDILKKLSPEAVQAVWHRALERIVNDPEGAITSARALLETVCKHILDDQQVQYGERDDLPKLYKLTADSLNIAPSQHSESVFKQILGGCTAVVEGLGALRNRLGDAHGSGSRRVKPATRHGQLAVNLSGAMTSFLVATWQARKHGTS